MFRTQFLIEQTNDHEKTFSSLNVFEVSSKKINFDIRKKVFFDINQKTIINNLFKFNDGSVELKKLNELYCLEYVPLKTDLILPKNPNLHDWVVLFYEPQTAVFDVSMEKKPLIKIRGNGKKIMCLYEPLLCDIPFLSLRLTFLGDADGWIVS